MSAPAGRSGLSSLATWEALCKDCRNHAIRDDLAGRTTSSRAEDLRQPQYEYSDVHATRQLERGQTRSDRCPECRKRHRKEIAAFPVAYVDITAIGEAATYVTDPTVGPTGPLGGLGPLPNTHTRRTETVDLDAFALGLTSQDIVDLLEKLQTHQVVILEAGTGTGKSTLAPFRLMNPPPNAPYRPTDIGPIVVTEPRVPATTEVAQFVGEAMCFGHDPETCFSHVGPGYPVGYQCEGQRNWDEACSLIYVTDGTMVNWITNGDLARIGTVIVDEAHERSENIDLILTLLAAQLPRYPHLRVIIASATIDKDYFTRFFQQTPSIRVDHQYVEADKGIGYGVPLFADIDFSEDVFKGGFTARDPEGAARFVLPGWSDEPLPEEDGRSLRALTRDVFLPLRTPAPQWPRGVEDAAVAQAMKILEGTDRGDILVFLPNRNMVLGAQGKLQAAVEAASGVGTVQVHWLMRATPKQDKKNALAPCPPGERKIVVASNLAETSLTIAGITYVVDSGLVSGTIWDPDLAVPAFPLGPHSQSGVRQRWGRVGRKTHGWVFPLYSLSDYLQMPRDTPAGSTQTNLEGTVLKLIAAGEDPSAVVFPADFEADGVVRDRFAQASADSFRRERLRALAAAQTNGAVGSDGKTLTRLGAELTRSRVAPEKAIALMFADRLACVPEVSVALAALAGREDDERDKGRLAGPGRMLASDPSWPIEWNVHARRCHEALAIGCIDDLDLVIRIFAEWRAAADPTQWCAQWWVNEDVLQSIEAAAAKLMDSLAPGMSHDATRPLDPRLTIRARAVLSRALGSLRYHRGPDGLWRSANPAQPDPVDVSAVHLTPAPEDVVALVRERPYDPRSGPVARHGRLLGLVSSLGWATEGAPTDFELLRRVSLRREETRQVDDPARATRAAFPIGALVRVVAQAGAEPSIEKLTDGLVKPVTRAAEQPAARPSGQASAAVVHTSETAATRDELNLPRRAGAEAAEEEVRLTPLPIRALEDAELEDFTGLPADVPDELDHALTESAPTTVVAGVPGGADSMSGVVVGYRFQASTVELVLDPEPPAHPVTREVGDELTVVVTGVVLTHEGPVNRFQVCDGEGRTLSGELLYAPGVTLDRNVPDDVSALVPGSTWTCRVMPGPTPGRTSLSFADSVLRRVLDDPGATSGVRVPTIAAVTATLTGEEFSDRKGNSYLLATTDAFEPDLVPRFAISVAHVEKAAVAAEAGARVSIDLRLDAHARRSGTWEPSDVDRLISERPEHFAAASRPEYVALTAKGPLQDDGLGHLLDADPSSHRYELNAWQLWETSRRVDVRRVSAVGEVDIAPDAVRSLQRSVDLGRLRKQFSVGITLSPTGTVSLVGTNEQVAAALEELRSAALRTTWRIELPERPDGRRPVFPRSQDVADALAGLAGRSGELVAGYDERRGHLVVESPDARAAAEQIADALSQVARHSSARLTFAEPRGFTAFQSRQRWEAIAASVDGLSRWSIQAGVAWGLLAADPSAVARGVAAIRAALPAHPFSVSETESIGPRVREIPPIADRFDVGYRSPVAAPAGHESASGQEQSRPAGPGQLRPDVDGPDLGGDVEGTAEGGREDGLDHDSRAHAAGDSGPVTRTDTGTRVLRQGSVRDRLAQLRQETAAVLSDNTPADRERSVRQLLRDLRASLAGLDSQDDRSAR